MTNIHIHKGSILDVKADAVVNPANSFLDHKGGLARVIAAAARQREGCFVQNEAGKWRPDFEGRAAALQWHEEQVNAPLIATGNAYHTSPGNLPFKGVIHAVGPIWNDGGFMERYLLEMVHERVLYFCCEHAYKSVVFPAISCGVFGFPVEIAAPIAAQVASWGSDYGVEDVTFALMDDEHVAAFRKALAL